MPQPLCAATSPRRKPRAGRATPSRHAVLIGRAMAHVEAHLDARLDADVLADRAAMSTGAARQAFGELMAAVGRAGLMPAVASCIALMPDDPKGPDDPHCRYVAGVVFGHDLARGAGRCQQPDLPLSGSLAWWPIAPGRYVEFIHQGPYDTLYRSWAAIYRDWLPASGETLHDAPPLELVLNDPASTPPAELLTALWIPLA